MQEISLTAVIKSQGCHFKRFLGNFKHSLNCIPKVCVGNTFNYCTSSTNPSGRIIFWPALPQPHNGLELGGSFWRDGEGRPMRGPRRIFKSCPGSSRRVALRRGGGGLMEQMLVSIQVHLLRGWQNTWRTLSRGRRHYVQNDSTQYYTQRTIHTSVDWGIRMCDSP